MKDQFRPVFLNLFQIHFPVTAIVSIFHRVTGVLLFLSIPFLIGLLHYSKLGGQHFTDVEFLFIHKPFWFQCLFFVVAFSTTFHLFCGIKHLLTDVGLGTTLASARKKAWIVIALTVVVNIYVLFKYII